MTSIELEHLQGVLETRKTELEEVLGNREAIAVGSSSDMLDQIQHASECAMAIGNLERELVRLREVRGALGRIQLGTFGICLECEEKSAQSGSLLCRGLHHASVAGRLRI